MKQEEIKEADEVGEKLRKENYFAPAIAHHTIGSLSAQDTGSQLTTATPRAFEGYGPL